MDFYGLLGSFDLFGEVLAVLTGITEKISFFRDFCFQENEVSRSQS